MVIILEPSFQKDEIYQGSDDPKQCTFLGTLPKAIFSMILYGVQCS